MIHVMIIIIKMMTHIVILTLVIAIKHQRHNGLMMIVTDKPPARGLCAEVGATVSVTSAFASRGGPAKLATVRCTSGGPLCKNWVILIIVQESTEPCLVEGGPYGGVYDDLVCAGHGSCR